MPSQYAGKHSGVARVVFSLLEQLLLTTNFEFILRSPWKHEQLPENLLNSRLTTLTIKRPRIVVVDVIRQMFIIPRLCRRLGIDTVLNADPFGSPTGGKSRSMIVHDLYFKTIPDEIGWRATKTTDIVLKLMIAGCNQIVCVSDATRHDVNHWYPKARSKTITIHSASTMNIPAETKLKAPNIARPYILVVGNATPNKNFSTVGMAFNELKSAYPELKLVHVGSDPEEEILNAIENGDLRNSVTRLIGIDDLELAGLYHHALCLCVPSLYEGFCLPVLEAQQFGCPVVCSNTSATPEIAGDGALTFDPKDIDALVEAVSKLLREPGLPEGLVTRGSRNLGRFSWKKAAMEYIKVLNFHKNIEKNRRSN